MQDFPTILAALMETRDLSQSDVARAAGVNRSRVSEWRNGVGVPSPQTLERIAEAFGQDLDRLMHVCGYRTRLPQALVEPDELEILTLYRQAPPEKKPEAKSFLLWLSGPVPPVERPTSGKRRRTAIGSDTPASQRERMHRDEGETGPGDALPQWCPPSGRHFWPWRAQLVAPLPASA